MSHAGHHHVSLKISHPEGMAEGHEKIVAEAEALAVKHLETHGFEVESHHVHTRTRQTRKEG